MGTILGMSIGVVALIVFGLLLFVGVGVANQGYWVESNKAAGTELLTLINWTGNEDYLYKTVFPKGFIEYSVQFGETRVLERESLKYVCERKGHVFAAEGDTLRETEYTDWSFGLFNRGTRTIWCPVKS